MLSNTIGYHEQNLHPEKPWLDGVERVVIQGQANRDQASAVILFQGTTMPDTFIEPYLFFGEGCEEALDFYRTTLGAQVEILLCHKDSPEPPPPGLLLGSGHACFRR